MRILFSAAPGASLQSKALPNGASIKGIQIDNPNGAWLYIVSEKLFVPPYTIGWATPLSYEQTSITVNYAATGPASQVSTLQGDPWELQLFDEDIEASAGVPYQFTSVFTPALSDSNGCPCVTNTPIGTAAGTPVLTGVANKRIRIRSVYVHVKKSGAPLLDTGDSGVEWTLKDVQGAGLPGISLEIAGFVRQGVPYFQSFGDGVDAAIGASIYMDCQCDFADTLLVAAFVYNLI